MIFTIVLSLCLFFFFIQLILLIYWSRGIIKISKENKYQLHTNSNEGISVIVCIHNQEAKIKVLLPALLGQDHPHFEVVIVNINSDEATTLFINNEKNLHENLKVVNISYIPPHVTTKKYALTLGIKAASYDIVAFTEAHCIPHSDWLKSIANSFQNDKEIKFSIGYSPYFTEKTLLNRIIQYDTTLIGMQCIGSLGNKRPFMANGKNLAYRKSFFLENKGFEKSITYPSGYDDIYVNKWATPRNTTGVFFKESIVYSYPYKKLIDFWKQKLIHLNNRSYYTHGRFSIYIWEFSQVAFYISFISLFFLIDTISFLSIPLLFICILPIRFFSGEYLFYYLIKKADNKDSYPAYHFWIYYTAYIF